MEKTRGRQFTCHIHDMDATANHKPLNEMSRLEPDTAQYVHGEYPPLT